MHFVWKGGSVRILVACECSGVVREAFRAKGHDAWSVDFLPSVRHGRHIQSDARSILNGCSYGAPSFVKWDMMIAHPPCDYLTNSAAWAYKDPDFVRYPGVGYHQRLKPGTLFGAARREARENARDFFLYLWNCGINRIAIENPIGHMNTHSSLPNNIPGRQIIQPYEFGEDASKSTVLWLKNLPPLNMTEYVEPRAVCNVCGYCEAHQRMFSHGCPECGADAGKVLPRWSNQTDAGQNRLSPSDDRASVRAVTYRGIAQAMADQWT